MPSIGYLSILYKMLEKHLWNSFLLYLVVEILQLVHKIAVSLRCSIKEAQNIIVFWKTPQNSNTKTQKNKHKKQSSGGVLSKENMFLKILQNSQKSIFSVVAFLIK